METKIAYELSSSEPVFSYIVPNKMKDRLFWGPPMTKAEIKSLPKGMPYSLHYAGIERLPLIAVIPGTRTPLYRPSDLYMLFLGKGYQGTTAFIGQRSVTNSRVNIPFSQAHLPALFMTIRQALWDKTRFDPEKGEIYSLTPQQAIYKAWVKFFRLRFLRMTRVEFSALMLSVEGRTHGSKHKLRNPSLFSATSSWEETTPDQMVTLPSWDTFHHYLWPLWVRNIELGWPRSRRVCLNFSLLPSVVPWDKDKEFIQEVKEVERKKREKRKKREENKKWQRTTKTSPNGKVHKTKRRRGKKRNPRK